MKKFKAMKFWVNNDKFIIESLYLILRKNGYNYLPDEYKYPDQRIDYIIIDKDGSLLSGRSNEFDKSSAEEININWMREIGNESETETVTVTIREYLR